MTHGPIHHIPAFSRRIEVTKGVPNMPTTINKIEKIEVNLVDCTCPQGITKANNSQSTWLNFSYQSAGKNNGSC